MSGDPTTFARTVKAWACEEMLKQIRNLLGAADGDDLINTVKTARDAALETAGLKRRVAELQKELEGERLVVRTLSGANKAAMDHLAPYISNPGGSIVEAAREAAQKLSWAEVNESIICGVISDTETHTGADDPNEAVRDVVDQLTAAEARVEELERERLRHLEDSKRDALTVAVRQVGEAINAQNRLLRVALDQQWPLWNIESRDR